MSERKPRIGILGIMQDLYDDMIPGIAQRQEGYAAELAAHLSDAASSSRVRPSSTGRTPSGPCASSRARASTGSWS